MECKEYIARVFTHRRRTDSDREPSHQTGNGAADSLSLLILTYADAKCKNRPPQNVRIGNELRVSHKVNG